MTHICPVYEGFALPHLTKRLDIAGTGVKGHSAVTNPRCARPRHHEILDQAAAAARLRVQPHGRLRDGADDEGEAVLRGVQHPRRAEARPGDNLPRRALHTARRSGHQGHASLEMLINNPLHNNIYLQLNILPGWWGEVRG